MNPLFAIAVIILLAFISIAIVLSISSPVIELSEETVDLKDLGAAMKKLDSFIIETSKEGTGATRTARLNLRDDVAVISEEDAVQYELQSEFPLIESFSRILDGNLITISGNDVTCQAGANLVMENTYLRAEFQNIPKASPHSSINTIDNVLSLKEKTTNRQINLTNSSVIIDDDSSTSSGTGYSEILKEGTSLPACTVHFFINSANADYDAYYILYAGADFLVMEVRNMK